MKAGSRLEKVLRAGHFAVTGELGPPKSAEAEVVRKKARLLRGHVDAVNITDCQTAIVRMSSIAAGLLAQDEGLEPVIQMTCRDRNRIGMQSDILGASALGLKNLLCLTGDHQKFGNHPGAKGVFDMDSVQLLGMMRDLRDSRRFQCGEEIKTVAPELFLGAAANPFAGPSVEQRARRLAKKVAAGADFVQTQIIYNVEKFARFMEVFRDLGLEGKVFLLAGITPPRSLGMARYMKNSVPGLEVPEEIITRMRDARDKEDEGINICVDLIRRIREIKGVSGVHIMAIEWEAATAEIVRRAGLEQRPEMDAPAQTSLPAAAAITGAPKAAVADDEKESILALARIEAQKIVAAARAQADSMGRSVPSPGAAFVQESMESVVAGEDEMNEKERQMALASVRLGLESLKKAFGLSDDQMEALARFAAAEAVLNKTPAGGVMTPVVAVAAAAPAAAADDSAAIAAKKAEQERQAAAVKADEDSRAEEARRAASQVEEARLADEARKTLEAKEQAVAQQAEAAQKAAEAKKTADAAKASPPVAASVAVPAAAGLALEKTTLGERAGRVPADHYTIKYSGSIREGVLGSAPGALSIGGAASLPFYLFEGAMPNKPLIAMDVLDIRPEEWPDTLFRHFADVAGDPVAWARKCVKEYGADAVCFSLLSTDPNGMNRPAAEAATAAAEVIAAVDVPVIVWGCGNSEKDTETLRDLTARLSDRKICLAPLSDANYRTLGASAMAFGHQMVAASPIDVNLAKQLNILLENLGVSLHSVLMDPSIGALGYGIEYTYSVMERIRLAALTQKDEKLQVPFICNLGREVWKTKECKLPSDALLGDQESRGVMMEAITAVCMLLSGGDLLVMRHPGAVALTRSLIQGLSV